MHLLFLFLYSCLFIQIIFPQEYIYPIAAIENGKRVLLIHQQSPIHIELWFWDPITKQVEEGLWSLFDPAGLQLLPDLSGFSFVDKGRLQIKFFNKRAPKSIDIYEPVHSINLVHWIDSHFCYLSAQYGDNFSIYKIGIDGSIYCLASCAGKDCLYPQKIDNSLFYIERSKIITDESIANGYRVMKMTISSSSDTSNKNILLDESPCMRNTITPELIMEWDEKPIIFLHMLSEKEGFLIEHPAIISSRDVVVEFHYHKIGRRNDASWIKEKIFSFAIPSSLLLHESSEQLYESLLPLLPRIADDYIYFVDCSRSDQNNLEVYRYEIATQKNTKVCYSSAQGQHFFVPFFLGSRTFIGGAVNESVQRWIDEKLGMCVDLITF